MEVKFDSLFEVFYAAKNWNGVNHRKLLNRLIRDYYDPSFSGRGVRDRFGVDWSVFISNHLLNYMKTVPEKVQRKIINRFEREIGRYQISEIKDYGLLIDN